MRWRWVGVLAVVAGVAVVLHGADPLDPIGAQFVVAAVGVVALVAATLLALTLPALDGEHWRPDDVESGLSVRTPGEDVADLSQSDFRTRLRALVADALVAQGHSPAEAEEMLDEGDWTDDRFAAACLGDQSLRDDVTLRLTALGSSTHLSDLVRARVTSELLALREEAGVDR